MRRFVQRLRSAVTKVLFFVVDTVSRGGAISSVAPSRFRSCSQARAGAGRGSAVGVLLAVVVSGGCALPPSEVPSERILTQQEMASLSELRQGLFYYNTGRYAEAEKHFLYARRLYPQVPGIALNLALAQAQQGSVEEGLLLLDSLEVEESLPRATLLGARALLYRLSGDFDAAIVLYRRAFEESLDANEPARAASFAESLSSLFYLMGEEESAMCGAFSAAQLRGRTLPSVEGLVKMLLATGRFSRALRELEAFTIENPGLQDARVLYYLALAPLGTGDVRLARNYLDSALLLPAVEPVSAQGMTLLRQYLDEDFRKESASEEVLEDEAPELYAGAPLESEQAFLWPASVIEYLMQRPFPSEGE